MTTIAAFLTDLQRRGIKLIPAGDRLRFAPPDRLTKTDLEQLKAHKSEILHRLSNHEPLPAHGDWDTATARALVDEVLREQEALNTRWPWPETRAAWEALWELGDQIDDAYLAEDLPALRDAIDKWRERAKQSP